MAHLVFAGRCNLIESCKLEVLLRLKCCCTAILRGRRSWQRALHLETLYQKVRKNNIHAHAAKCVARSGAALVCISSNSESHQLSFGGRVTA